MKHGWEVKKLGEVCEIITKGTTPTSLGFEFTQKGVNFIKVESLTLLGEIIPNKIAYISEECHNTLKRSQLKENDILFSIAGALGRIGIVNKNILPANTNQALAIIRVAKDSKLMVRFLAKYFISNSIMREVEKLKGGAAQQNLSLGQLTNLLIPLPPLSEQQRIVTILEEACEAINQAKENAEQNLKNAQELYESYLQSVFETKGKDWEEKTLKEVCTKITDGTHQTPKYFKDGVIFLSSKNVTSGKIDWDNVKYIDEVQHLEMHNRVAPKVGDILLAKNGTTGVAAMVDRDIVFDIYVSLAHIRVLEEVLPEFMLYFINSPFAKQQFNKRLKGMGVPNLHLEEIREVVIPFPRQKNKQETIVAKLDALSEQTKKLESIYEQKLANLEELKKSILQKAFNGEL
ncbi:restriction endonuclease subunit S [Sulfurospirillum cavolei]|uniref:restriction endonuclease subunit S n=1 Tax=Sulfurospirillum cavolei TaxID=366522 RepID=UPI003FA1E097